MLRTLRRSWTLGTRTGLGCAVLSLACTPATAQSGEPAAYAPQAGDVRPALPEPERSPDPGQVALDRRIEEVDRLLARAHFRTALGLARNTLGALDSTGAVQRPDTRRARLEVLAATAEVAMGRRAAARESLGRALRADPALELDAKQVSPKVMKLLEEARAARGGEEAKR